MDEVTEVARWTLDIRIVAALIGVFAFLVAQTANAFFVSLRDRKQIENEKRDIALFARAELINVKRHQEANVIKLGSILDSSSFGEKIDYDKLKLTDTGLVALDLAKVYILKQELAQDLLRFSLFCRNNELEISNVFATVESNCSDDEKSKAVQRLKNRLLVTINIANEISLQLKEYSNSPKKYIKNGIAWSDSLFKIKK